MTTENSTFELFSALLVVGIAQGVFLILAILAAPKRPDGANRFLAGLVSAFALELVFRFLLETGFLQYLPQSLSLHWALDTWFGPLLYLYTYRLASPPAGTGDVRARKHFAIPLAATGLAIGLWALYSAPDFLAVAYASAPVPLEITEIALALIGLASMVFYLVKSFEVLRTHRARIAQNFSYSEKVGLNWLRNLLLVVAVLLAVYVPLTVSGWFAEVFDRIYGVSIVLAVFGIGFLGIRQPNLFVRDSVGAAEFVTDVADDTGEAGQKYRKSALSGSEIEAIYAAIIETVDSRKLYLVSDLSLPVLADTLGLSSHYVSQAINQGSGSNFFDFINKRRVRHVAEKLRSIASGDRVNILSIAMDAGFSSKSAFYKAFRSHMGQSPTQYRRAAL
ncbi:MAG: AraC family transcriptional regulator [Woeseiaceae bacterium]|nr:AraC family transcriptional regulator [Woeseiaceae bacterium]